MAIPKVGVEEIERALKVFDDSLRLSDEWKYWEESKTQTWVIVHGEKRYPPKKIISMATGVAVSSFSGGPESNDYLAERGFTVRRLREVSLAETLRLILERYGPARFNSDFAGHHEIKELFNQARRAFSQSGVVSSRSHLSVVASYGKGNWAAIPWISFLDDRETSTTQQGTYVVYLFREDGQGCYVKLAQGVTQAEKEFGASAKKRLEERAALIRRRCDSLVDLGFDISGKTDLATSNKLGRLYEASTIVSKYYAIDQIPTDGELLNDLDALLAAYEEYVVESRGAGAAVVDDARPIALIGTSRSLKEKASTFKSFIEEHGGWASWWSFPIKDAARSRLIPPFYLYIYEGRGSLIARFRIDEFVSSKGSEGIVSPWPDITEPHLRNVSQAGPKQSDICKTWFRVGAIEVFPTPRSVDEFEIASGLSKPTNLLNQNSFGYILSEDFVSILDDSKPRTKSIGLSKERPPEMGIQWLAASTGLSLKVATELVSTITGSSPQIILSGPPGTSKTWVARQLALYLTRNRIEQVRFVQFHQSYTYESFIEGLRPVVKGNSVGFELKPGVVLDVVSQMLHTGAVDSDWDEFVIVIDEANRANLPRVLGELMFLFEYRGEAAHLQYSGQFSLPKNLRFIATMNTADRSIRSIDAALRRRFDVFELGPDVEILKEFHARSGDCQVPDLLDGFISLNDELQRSLDRHHTIGHAFFMRAKLTSEDLRGIWNRKIFPLIEEYFFDQPEFAADFSCERFWPSVANP